jgi:hypothetical protein
MARVLKQQLKNARLIALGLASYLQQAFWQFPHELQPTHFPCLFSLTRLATIAETMPARTDPTPMVPMLAAKNAIIS